ncbi:hypothetical protein NPIL_267421 [Nephila pilipes]|uniref:Uncharacterized protein n=1 Tax=Nephila pilipes TaxID=299642 RepID=A0A8X6MPZ3_NEPPI|nr:hypothetical protein NPIL_267421 [Nephila pilipes]
MRKGFAMPDKHHQQQRAWGKLGGNSNKIPIFAKGRRVGMPETKSRIKERGKKEEGWLVVFLTSPTGTPSSANKNFMPRKKAVYGTRSRRRSAFLRTLFRILDKATITSERGLPDLASHPKQGTCFSPFQCFYRFMGVDEQTIKSKTGKTKVEKSEISLAMELASKR